MYAELIKRLRNRRICVQQSGGLDDFPLLREAADAIEELQKNRVCRIVEKDGETELFIENRWISVTERLPEKRKWVLCRCKSSLMEVLRWENNEWYHDPMHRYFSSFVTHWQPLPELPEEET